MRRGHKKKVGYRDFIKAWKESRYELDDPPEILGCLGVLTIAVLVFAGVKGCF